MERGEVRTFPAKRGRLRKLSRFSKPDLLGLLEFDEDMVTFDFKTVKGIE